MGEKTTDHTYVWLQARPIAFIGLLPNIGGSSSSRRAILAGATQNILLIEAHRTPKWIKALEQKENVEQLGKVQRNMLLRVASAYRTALRIIADDHRIYTHRSSSLWKNPHTHTSR